MLMREPFRTTRRVAWHDTDAAGIAHFTAFLRYMEDAEHELLRHVGLSVLARDDEGPITWPRVAVRCDFTASVTFEDVLDIEVRVARIGEKSVTYRFQFAHDGRPIAHGVITAVCCRLDPQNKTPQSIAIPEWIAAQLRQAVCDVGA